MTAREVRNEKSRLRYANDPEYREKVKENARRYREAHPEKVREYIRKYNAEHPITTEARRAYDKAYREHYKERVATDPEFAKADKRKRVARARRLSEKYRLRYANDPEYREKMRQKSKEYQARKRKERLNDDRSTEES